MSNAGLDNWKTDAGPYDLASLDEEEFGRLATAVQAECERRAPRIIEQTAQALGGSDATP